MKHCKCNVCDIARTSGTKKHPLVEALEKKVDKNKQSPPAVLKQCQVCLSYLGKGWKHKCDKSTKRNNLEGIVKASSKKSKTRIVSTGLKQVFSDAEVSTKGGTLELATKGRPLTVNLGTRDDRAPPKGPKWDLDSLIKLQSKTSLSDRNLL